MTKTTNLFGCQESALAGSARQERDQPRLRLACERLEAFVAELAPGTKLPNVRALRDELGVSLTTLYTAFEALEERGVVERRANVGVFVAQRRMNNVVLLCEPSFFEGQSLSPLWGLLAKHLRLHAEAEGGALEFQFSRIAKPGQPPVSPFLAKALTQGQVHGVLALGLHFQTMQYLQELGVPRVGFACCYSDDLTHRVKYAHDREFYAQGAAILREANCQRVEVWQPVLTWLWPRYADHEVVWRQNDEGSERAWNQTVQGRFASAFYRSFRSMADAPATANAATANAATAAVAAEPAWTPPPGVYTHTEQGAMLARHVFSRPRETWPEGILFWDDLLAHGALGVMEELGIEAGRDVQIVSQSNAGSPVLERERGTLSLLEFCPRETVNTMFSVLHALMRDEPVTPTTFWIHASRRDIKR